MKNQSEIPTPYSQWYSCQIITQLLDESPIGYETQAELSAMVAYLPTLSLTQSLWTGGQYDSDSNSYKWIGSNTPVDGSMFESGLDSLNSNYNVCLRASSGKLAAFNNGIGFAAICEDYA